MEGPYYARVERQRLVDEAAATKLKNDRAIAAGAGNWEDFVTNTVARRALDGTSREGNSTDEASQDASQRRAEEETDHRLRKLEKAQKEQERIERDRRNGAK